MSIYGSFGGFDEYGEDERQPPIVYQGSHILPSMTDPRGGAVDLAHIPGFISREGPHADTDDTDPRPARWPYLRLSVDDDQYAYASVILDVHQVDTLIEDLQSWRATVDMGKLDK